MKFFPLGESFKSSLATWTVAFQIVLVLSPHYLKDYSKTDKRTQVPKLFWRKEVSVSMQLKSNLFHKLHPKNIFDFSRESHIRRRLSVSFEHNHIFPAIIVCSIMTPKIPLVLWSVFQPHSLPGDSLVEELLAQRKRAYPAYGLYGCLSMYR